MKKEEFGRGVRVGETFQVEEVGESQNWEGQEAVLPNG